MKSTAHAPQPTIRAIHAIQESFECIRRREVERHHHRFSCIDRDELDRITRAITQQLLAVPIARLEKAGETRADVVRGIGHLHTLFSRPECADGSPAAAAEQEVTANLRHLVYEMDAARPG